MESLMVLTPQELKFIKSKDGKEKISPRVLRIIKSIRQKPYMSVERARLMTESFRKTEGQPAVLRWAKAMKHTAENIALYIGDDDLVVGRACGTPGRYGILYPEVDGGYLKGVVQNSSTRTQAPFTISEEDKKIILDEIEPYWSSKSYYEAFAESLPQDTKPLIFNPEDIYTQRDIIFATTSFRSSLNWCHDYEKVLKRGFKDIRKEAEERLAALDQQNPIDILEKVPFLEAVIHVCDAIICLSKRYAAHAADMAEKENDEQRKKELLEISEICNWVPENPARSFHEAVQAQWFTQMFSRIEQRVGSVVANGRMDQYLYPFYKKDITEGRITEEGAIELFQCLWTCIGAYADLYITPTGTKWAEGYAHFEALTLGGKTRDGKDATNDLSYLILQSKKGLPLNFPDLAARVHSQTPDRFLYEICETIKDGEGYPKIFNDEDIIPLYLAKGANIEEANDYCMCGCTEPRLVNRETYVNPGAWINLGAIIEMTLRDGKMKKYGDLQLGVKTGDPTEYESYDDLWFAFRTQFENALKHAMIQQYVADDVKPKYQAAPMASLLNNVCMNSCKDIHSKFIEGGLDFVPMDMVGFGTAVDSLAAIKKLVFEEKKVSMHDLLEALECNFEGRENIRQILLNAPKYCNGEQFADDIGYNIEKIAVSYFNKYQRKGGGQFDIRQVPITTHIPAGAVVAATPNGRKANQYLSEGASASHGADKKGPTAILLSNSKTKCFSYKERATRLLNIKLSPSSVAGDEGTRKLMSFIRSFCDLKLWHIQFMVINQETLLAAQRDPEKYGSLIVRVAGYSAYFCELTRDLQNEIIDRTQHAI